MRQVKIYLTLALGALFLTPTFVFAQTPPSFPTCPNPGGKLLVSYPTGIHGIVGRSQEYRGSDEVYELNSDQYVQCFCAEDGSGIQTSWWRISSLTTSEIENLKRQGWHYIPTGSVWGLSSDPFLATNNDFSCKVNSTSNSNSSSSSTNSESSSSTSGGQVLGLATTGNIKEVLSLLSFGFVFFALGIYLRKSSKKLS